jgi:hypothetical protein
VPSARPRFQAPSGGVDRLEFTAAILGRDLSRENGSDRAGGGYRPRPKGIWIATKLFLGESQAEVFSNLDPAGGWGEFALKDPAHARDALRELGRVRPCRT